MSEDLASSRPGTLAPPAYALQGTDAIRAWLVGLVKTIRASRLYNENSELRQRFAGESFEQLERLLEEHEDLTLFVREDRLVFQGEDVLIQPDRQDGLPFVLYRNAFRRITFRPGWTYEQLMLFLLELNREMIERDPTVDLVSQLWNLALPCLSYVTIDSVLSASSTAADDTEKREIEEIQEEIEGILSAIYQTAVGEDDLVENLNIDHLDLLALQRAAEDEDNDEALDRTTERAILGIDADEIKLATEKARAERGDRPVLRRTSRIFVDILARTEETKDSVAVGATLIRIVDNLLEQRDFDFLIEFVGYLRGQRLADQPGARYAVDQLTSRDRLGVLLASLNEAGNPLSFSKMVDLVAALGSPAVPACLDALVSLTEPGQRRVLIDLLVQLGISDPKLILDRFGKSEWFVDRDLLSLAQSLPPDSQAAVILKGLDHANAQVRIAAVAQLRNFREGTADRLLARTVTDPDLNVRLAAIRVAAARKSQPCLPALRELIADEDFASADPRLIRLATLAYARLAGDVALAVLEPLLHPGFFSSFKSMDAQLAAVVAIGAIGTPASQTALERGRKSMNKSIREACKKALQSAPDASLEGEEEP